MIERKPNCPKRFLEILQTVKFPICLTIINPDNEYVIYELQIQKVQQLEKLLEKRHLIIDSFKHCSGVVKYINRDRDSIGELLKWK